MQGQVGYVRRHELCWRRSRCYRGGKLVVLMKQEEKYRMKAIHPPHPLCPAVHDRCTALVWSNPKSVRQQMRGTLSIQQMRPNSAIRLTEVVCCTHTGGLEIFAINVMDQETLPHVNPTRGLTRHSGVEHGFLRRSPLL